MIKSELILFLSKKIPNLSEKKIHSAINLLLQQLSESLIAGHRIEIRGFGSFSLHHRSPRQAYNPKTGNRLTTESRNIPHFKPGKTLKQGIDDSKHYYPIIDIDAD